MLAKLISAGALTLAVVTVACEAQPSQSPIMSPASTAKAIPTATPSPTDSPTAASGPTASESAEGPTEADIAAYCELRNRLAALGAASLHLFRAIADGGDATGAAGAVDAAADGALDAAAAADGEEIAPAVRPAVALVGPLGEAADRYARGEATDRDMTDAIADFNNNTFSVYEAAAEIPALADQGSACGPPTATFDPDSTPPPVDLPGG